MLRHQLVTEALCLGSQNLLGFVGGSLTLARIVVGNIFQVVKVMEENALDVAHRWVNVAGHGEVDDHQGLIFLLCPRTSRSRTMTFGFLAAENRVRTGSRTDDDVGLRHVLPAFLKRDRKPTELRRQLCRVIEGATDYAHADGNQRRG